MTDFIYGNIRLIKIYFIMFSMPQIKHDKISLTANNNTYIYFKIVHCNDEDELFILILH